jgi:hypothetical protein
LSGREQEVGAGTVCNQELDRDASSAELKFSAHITAGMMDDEASKKVDSISAISLVVRWRMVE